MAPTEENFNNIFGDIDLELLDLILKGHFDQHQRVLDVGCGEGRNLIFFFQRAFDVYALDSDRSSVELVKYMAKNFGKDPDKIIHQNILDENLSFGAMDAIICSRVLHFSENETDFLKAWHRLSHMLKSGGLLYLSVDSMIGFQKHVKPVTNNQWQFNDGSVRFLLNEELLKRMDVSRTYESLVPMKTINFEDQHANTVFCLKKK